MGLRELFGKSLTILFGCVSGIRVVSEFVHQNVPKIESAQPI
jgi:hypothetical protein